MTGMPVISTEPPKWRLLTVLNVAQHLNVDRATIFRYMKDDPTFPKPRYLSPRVMRWDEAGIVKWAASRTRQVMQTAYSKGVQ